MKYQYSIGDYNEFTEFNSPCEFKGRCNSTEDYIAEDAAKHHYETCTGPGEEWSTEITIKTMDDELVGNFNVFVRYIPKFIARRKK